MDLRFRDWLIGAVMIIATAVIGVVCGAGMILLARGTL
jgi:hypothetical protein